MGLRNAVLVLFFSFLTLAMNACGEKTNINQLFVSSAEKKSLESLLQKAEIAYDSGDFDTALDFAEQARDINSANERVVVLLGYIYLSKAGIDSFTLASGLTSLNSTKTTLTATTDAAATLSSLSTILGITTADLKIIADNSTSSLALFKDYDLLFPKKASVARASGIASLEFVNKAIAVICPFVDTEVKIDTDSRHSATNCVPTTNDRFLRAKSHFLWAFSHLTEALAFYSVLLYQPTGKTQPNIQSRADQLKANSSSVSITDTVSYYNELTTAVDAIFPAGDADSQLAAVLADLKAVQKGFSVMAGVPKSLTNSIDNSITTIESKRSSVSGATDSAKDAASLKNQLTAKMAASLSTQISTLAAANPAQFAANKSALCSSYTSIAGSAAVPAECQ